MALSGAVPILSLFLSFFLPPTPLNSLLINHYPPIPLEWSHNGRDSVSNHQPDDCLFNRLFRRRSKKTSKLRVTGLCAGNSPGTDEFPAQRPVTRKMFPLDDVIMHLSGLSTYTSIQADVHYSCNQWMNDPMNESITHLFFGRISWKKRAHFKSLRTRYTYIHTYTHL